MLNILVHNVASIISSQFSHSTLCRILHKVGYAYKTPGTNNTTLAHETRDMATYRLSYMRAVIAARSASKEIVYLDESYINASHHDNRCWLKPDSKVNKRSPLFCKYW